MLAAIAATAFLWRLDQAPVYLSPDEAIISVDAHAIATTGRDVTGRRLPLYFQIQMPGEDRTGWFTPAIMYLSALIQTVRPLSERVARLPSALVGVADVVLIYLVALRIFKSQGLAVLAAALLLTTPAHFVLSRYALDYEYPLPFILGWLLGLLTFVESGRTMAVVAATACLGLGFYSYMSSVFMMPLYFGFTWLVLTPQRAPRRTVVLAMVTFAALLVPFAAWLVLHPTALVDTAQRYEMYDTTHLNALQGMRSFLGYQNLDQRAALYWSFFNPSFLFFSGDQLITFSTRRAGVFLLPMALALGLGVFAVLRAPRTLAGPLVLASFMTAPLAAVLATTEQGAIIRAAGLMPFGVLLAVYGFRHLLTMQVVKCPSAALSIGGGALTAFGVPYAAYLLVAQHRMSASGVALIVLGAGLAAVGLRADRLRQGRWLAAGVVAAMAIQFGAFWIDYFGAYRVRTAPWLSGNLSGALEALIDVDRRSPAPRVYFTVLRSTGGVLDIRNRWIDSYWRFYVIKHHREELLDRTTRAFELAGAAAVPGGSLLLADIGDRTVAQMIENHTLTVERVISEIDRQPFFVVLRK